MGLISKGHYFKDDRRQQWIGSVIPYSGWKKGNVERKAAFNHNHLFVLVPHFTSIADFDLKLLQQHEKKLSELHYKKQVPIEELYEKVPNKQKCWMLFFAVRMLTNKGNSEIIPIDWEGSRAKSI
ncbi:MAG: hypothetical protein PHY47_20110 [Lachnospiraceae bacterium]|nr:hypothetical protein [Lachnospiraceae bacterium]